MGEVVKEVGIFVARPLMGRAAVESEGGGQPTRLRRGKAEQGGGWGDGRDDKRMKQAGEDGREGPDGVNEWWLRPDGGSMEALTCAALTGAAPASWRGPGADRMPMLQWQ